MKMKKKFVRDVMFWGEIWRWIMCQLEQRDQAEGSEGQQHESKKKCREI